jgi:hypothetical protein
MHTWIVGVEGLATASSLWIIILILVYCISLVPNKFCKLADV